ncbi:MAG: DUF1269 domain-containing protein [Streptosporangiaceae bacterium]
MAHLVVLGFDSKAKAEEVFNLGSELAREELVDLDDAALAWRDDEGKVKIQQAMPLTRAGAASGALWGTLIGLLFLAPVAGLAVGAATGAVGGKLSDVGIHDDVIKRIAGTLQPGRAAVFALVRSSTPDRVRAALRPYNPEVIHTSLTKDDEAELVRSLQ